VITVTKHFAHNIRTNHRECWSATSTDGVWTFSREETPGTPWIVRHNPTGWIGWFGSLPKARVGAEAQMGFDIAWSIIQIVGRAPRTMRFAVA
jgi:hypothetical protein